MQRIIINGKFLSQRVTGVQRFAREILLELDKLVSPGEIEIALPPDAMDVPNYNNLHILRVGKMTGVFWEQVSFPLYVIKRHALSLNLCNVAPILSPGYVCICDVKIKSVPQFFSWSFLIWYRILFRNAIMRAKSILTISQFSKDEIIKYYHAMPHRINVIHCAWQHYQRIDYSEEALDKYKLEKGSYYFAVSSLEPNKNFKWIAETAKQNPNCIFAVAGSINAKLFSDGLGFERPDNMRLLGYVSDEEAKTLMRDCKAFLFPSFYEGFGIPPLEAISAGAPEAIVSDIPVMHEVFGDYVCYVDISEECHKISELSAGKLLSCNGLLKKYSWAESAKRLYEILARI